MDMIDDRSRARATRRQAVLLLAALLTSLAGCARQPAFSLQSITGLVPQLSFQLQDEDGRAVGAGDYRGKVVLLYFGYTNCPDVCPTTLARLSQALRSLGPQAADVRVLFVTVDPQRDTTAHLKTYVALFGPQFVGLRGEDSALEALTRRYRVVYSRDPPDRNGDYSVQHSSAVFIFDQRGNARVLARDSDTSQAIAGDLRLLLKAP